MASHSVPPPRPQAPHLQIWRWHATMVASTLHRLTGIALWVGYFVLTAWIAALALGEEAYRRVEGILLSLPGQIVLFLFTAAALYHLVNGLRFLMWDGPRIGFDPKTASRVSILNMLIGAFGAVGLWALKLAMGG